MIPTHPIFGKMNSEYLIYLDTLRRYKFTKKVQIIRRKGFRGITRIDMGFASIPVQGEPTAKLVRFLSDAFLCRIESIIPVGLCLIDFVVGIDGEQVIIGILMLIPVDPA
jgi:hypothetical protein